MRRHAFDPFSFVFGVLFAFLSLFVLFGGSLADLGGMWAWAIPAMVVGTLIVLHAGRRLLDRDPQPPVKPPEA